MPTEPVDNPETHESQRPQALHDAPANEPRADQPANEDTTDDTPDDTPEYPLSAPIKPDDPERLTDQSKAETAGLVEEQLPPRPAELVRAKSSFKLAIGSAVVIALALGFELGRQVSQRR